MRRASGTAPRATHPYREAAARIEGETRVVTYGRALFLAQSFLVAWSLARIVVDVSCRKIDAEGIAAFVLCITLLPAILRRMTSR